MSSRDEGSLAFIAVPIYQTPNPNLQNPSDGITPIQAAAELLTELADDTERNGLTTVFIWRYMELNSDPKAFIKSLTSCDGIGENLVCGSATQANKVRYVSIVAET